MPLKMMHPDVDAVGEAVDEYQFRTVWEPRGWELVPAEVVLANETLAETVKDLDELTVGQLRELAAVQNIDVPAGAKKKDEIVKAIRSSSAATAAVTDPAEEA